MLASIALCALLGGCDPVGGPAASAPSATAPGAAAEEQLGAPGQELADTIEGIVAQVRTTALEWQDQPVLAEMAFTVADGAIVRAELTYVAGDSDRLLALDGTDDGFSQERTTLATLGLASIPAAAVEAIPGLPGGLPQPQVLAEEAADALAQCDVTPQLVVYATGAPWAWDGQQWTTPLGWTITATQSDGDRTRTAIFDAGALAAAACTSAG